MIYIYGAGGHGKVAFHPLIQQQKIVEAFIDDNVCVAVTSTPKLTESSITTIALSSN